MSGPSKPPSTVFTCEHCHEDIHISQGTESTTAPCPHCGKEVTSPAPDPDQTEQNQPEIPSVERTSDEQVIRLEVEEKGLDQVRGMGDLEAAIEPIMEDEREPDQGTRMIWVAGIIFMLIAGGLAIWLMQPGKDDRSSNVSEGSEEAKTSEQSEEEWLTSGWKEEATRVLEAFLKAKSPAERMKYVIPNEGVIEELERYYPEGKDDSDTPIEAFVHLSGREKDRKNGIFLMHYRRPPQIDIREHFPPILSLDKEAGVERASLLDLALQIHEGNVAKPIGINAFFKKRNDGLKLDASVFIQGKFRNFKAFVDSPEPGKRQLFRVGISETMVHELRDDKGTRTYRLKDHAYPKDHVNVSVSVDSEIGEILSELNWRDTNRDMIPRTATLELGWSDQKPPRLQIERFICWQFLGVGGEIGNATRNEETLHPTPASQAPVEPVNEVRD